jgi:hypothetical protein
MNGRDHMSSTGAGTAQKPILSRVIPRSTTGRHELYRTSVLDGKEGVAGSIPAEGSTEDLTSGNAD